MKKALLILLSLLLALGGLSAQTDEDETNIILDLLKYVPDNPTNRESGITYADYDAMYRMFGINRADYSRDEIRSALPATIMYFGGNEFANVSGSLFYEDFKLNLFVVERELSFGRPPETGSIWIGDFTDGYDEVLRERGYEVVDLPEGTLYTFEDPMETNFEERDPDIPFGGKLGQRHPVAILGNTLLTAYQNEIMDAMLNEPTSLAEDPAFQALASAFYDAGKPISAAIFPPIVGDPAMLLLGRGASPENLAQLREKLGLDDPANIPPAYEWGAIVNMWDGETQIADLLLWYGSEATASDGQAFWEERIETLDSLFFKRPLLQVLTEGDTTYEGISAEGQLLRLRFSDPLPDLASEDNQFIMPGRAFRLLYQMYMGREFFFILPE